MPKEPTEEMLEDGYYMDCVDIAKLKRSYKAMIAAAPKHGVKMLADELLKRAYFWCIPQFIANDNQRIRTTK